MAKGNHIRQRPGGWVFRKAIPKDLQARFGRREILRSLAKSPQNGAKFESRALDLACEEAFMHARSNESLSAQDLRAFSDALMARQAQQISEDWSSRAGRGGRDRRLDYECHRDVALAAALALREGRQIFEAGPIMQLAAASGIDPKRAQDHIATLQAAMAHAVGAFHAELAGRLKTAATPPASWLDLFRRPRVDSLDLQFDKVWQPPGSECCVAEGDDRDEAYTVIIWGVGSSHERLKIAGAEAVEKVEGNMCGSVMRGAVALPGSKATSRMKGSCRNLGDLMPPTIAMAVLGHDGKSKRRSCRGRHEESDGFIVPMKQPNNAAMSGGGGCGGKGPGRKEGWC